MSSVSDCYSFLDSERLHEILDNIPSPVTVVEKPDGIVTFANQKAIELYGMNLCGVKLKDTADILKIYTMDGEVCPTEQLYSYRALFNEETFLNAPMIIVRSDGRRFVFNVSAKPLYNKENNATSAVAIFDDVTEQFKSQEAFKESEDRLNMAQRIAHVGSWEYYSKEDKALWSDELFRIFGLKPQKYGPTTAEYAKRIHPEDQEKMDKTMQELLFKAKLSSRVSFDYRIVRDDGSIRTIHSERRVSEVDQEGKPARVVGIEQDITERKQIEQKLERYAKNLEQIIDERTKQLQNAERLAAIGQTAGMIGHDIRNPLQAIAGELFLMKQDVDSSPDRKCKISVQESLRAIQDQVDYINKIVSDLQDFTRPLKPEIAQVDLCTAIPQLLSTVSVPSNIKTVQDCQENLCAKVDLTFLKRILVNLVTNAIQAMPQGGNLTIKAFQEKNRASITIKDSGVGIPEEAKERLFTPLFTTKSKGQGFGLAVVKRLVEAQEGTVTFESDVGKGTQFKVTFQQAK